MNDTLSQGLTTIRLYGVLGKRFVPHARTGYWKAARYARR